MSIEVFDEFVPATPETPALLKHRPGMLRINEFKYYTPGNTPLNSPERLKVQGLGQVQPVNQPKLEAPSKGVADPRVSPPAVVFPNVRRKLAWGAGRRRANRSDAIDFKIYIYKVLRKLDPKGTISEKAMTVMNDMMADMFRKLATECSGLCKHNKRGTINAREMHTVVRLLIPGQLGKHAYIEGFKALKRYQNWEERNSHADQ